VSLVEPTEIACCAGAVSAAAGWSASVSPLVSRWVALATGAPSARSSRPARLAWVVANGAAGAAVAGALAAKALPYGVWSAPRGPGGALPIELVALVVWAFGLTVLAFVDLRYFVLPTVPVRLTGLATLALLCATGIWSRDWEHVFWGAICAGVALGVFGAWALANPQSLGFGDARMACLMALGAGAVSPGGALVALGCAPFIAGVIGKWRAAPSLVPHGRRVALGPIMALGGICVVVASAF
jgi:leader peptidase (prepilin peptidase)/N-methyltransferase